MAVGREIIQVRDVPSADVEVLRARAAARNMSLSGFLRELIREETSRPSMGEVLARIAGRNAVPTESAQVRAFVDGDLR